MATAVDTGRYAHNEGHTDVCYNDSGSKILTCGADGDVRIWEDIDDDDAVSHRVGEKAYAIAFKDNKFYTAVEGNTITAHSVIDGSPDGIVTRFTAPANHMVFSDDGKYLLAGAGDFHIKLVTVGSSIQKTFVGHEAPILSVSLDPKGEYIASSSCDGTVKVWQVANCECVQTWPDLLPKCNDVSLSKTLCRLTWSTKTGKYLVVPGVDKVYVYERDSWEVAFLIADKAITQNVNVVVFNPNGQYLAVACVDGHLTIWDFAFRDCLNRFQHANKHTICSLAWNPGNPQQIVFCDNHGQMGVINNVTESRDKTNDDDVTAKNDYDSLFAGDDDDLFGAATAPTSKKNILVSDDEDDTESVDLAKLKQKHAAAFGIMDDDSRDTDATSTKEAKDMEVPAYRPPIPEGPKLTPLQQPFQPSSSPKHLTERYMVWNAVGIVRAYNNDEETSIDIEFHDTATHHAMHISNPSGHTMAAMSTEAVVLACEADPEEKTNSKLLCMHFGTWDSAKEWTIEMPDKEDIKAITIGDTWVAVATSQRNVRLFTLGGVQKQLFTIPGPVVTMAGHSNQLMVIYHSAQGAPGEQCMSCIHLHVTSNQTQPMFDIRLPLSPKATLAWLGFSHEGTPMAIDSTGLLRMLNRRFSQTWIQVANLKSHTKGKSDNYWVTSVAENPQQIRCVLCKGSTYPPTLPRPNITILTYKLPLCEVSSERGQTEESYWRSQVFSGHYNYWASQNLEFDDFEQEQAKMAEKEALMKLFALACKADREYRALELCEMMPDQKTLQLAIKYASRSRHLQLAQRIGEVARRKQEEEDAAAQSMMGDVAYDTQDFRSVINASSQPTQSSFIAATAEQEAEDEVDVEDQTMETEEQDDDAKSGSFLTLKPKRSDSMQTPNPTTILSSQPRKNPFKIGTPRSASQSGSNRGTSVFDAMKKVSPASKTKATPVLIQPKKIVKKKNTQGKLFQVKKNSEESENTTVSIESPATETKRSAFQLWYEANKAGVQEDHPDVTDDDLIKQGMQQWRQLTKEERQEWQDKAKTETPATPTDPDKKRKRNEENIEHTDSSSISAKTLDSQDIEQNEPKKKKPLAQNTNAKLASFAFGK